MQGELYCWKHFRKIKGQNTLWEALEEFLKNSFLSNKVIHSGTTKGLTLLLVRVAKYIFEVQKLWKAKQLAFCYKGRIRDTGKKSRKSPQIDSEFFHSHRCNFRKSSHQLYTTKNRRRDLTELARKS